MAVRKKGKRARAKRARSAVTQSTVGIINVGHQIWLAGLGALARAQSEGPKLFESLVEEGSAVQERGREATQRAARQTLESVRGAIETGTEGVRDRAGETWDNLEKIFQSRVQKALQQLGVPTDQEIRSLSRKVNELTRSVQELTRHRPGARGAAGRKPGARSSASYGQGAAI